MMNLHAQRSIYINKDKYRKIWCLRIKVIRTVMSLKILALTNTARL